MGKPTEPVLKAEYTLFRADGTQQKVKPANGKKFQLPELRKLVGGSATFMHLGEAPRACITSVDEQGEAFFTSVNPWLGHMVRRGWVLVVNENGMNEGLPINKGAVEMWADL